MKILIVVHSRIQAVTVASDLDLDMKTWENETYKIITTSQGPMSAEAREYDLGLVAVGILNDHDWRGVLSTHCKTIFETV